MIKRKINIPNLKNIQLRTYNQAMQLLLYTTKRYFSLISIKDKCNPDYYLEQSNILAYNMGLACELYLKGLLLNEIELGYKGTEPLDPNQERIFDEFINSLPDDETYKILISAEKSNKTLKSEYNQKQTNDTDKIPESWPNQIGIGSVRKENLPQLGHDLSKLFNLYVEKKGANNALGKRMKAINDNIKDYSSFKSKYPGKSGLIDIYQDKLNSADKFFKEPFVSSRYPFDELQMPDLKKQGDNDSIADYDLFSFLVMLSTIAEDELKIGVLLVNDYNNEYNSDTTYLVQASDDGKYYYFDDKGDLQRVYSQATNNSIHLEYDTRSLDYLKDPNKIENPIPPYSSIMINPKDTFVCKINGKLCGYSQGDGLIFPIPEKQLEKYQDTIDDYNSNQNKYSDQIRKTRILEYLKYESTRIETTPELIGQEMYDFGKTITDEERKLGMKQLESIESKAYTPHASKDAENKKLREENEKLLASLKEKDKTIEVQSSHITKITDMLNRSLKFVEKVKHSFVGKLFFKDDMNKLPESKEDDEEQK